MIRIISIIMYLYHNDIISKIDIINDNICYWVG